MQHVRTDRGKPTGNGGEGGLGLRLAAETMKFRSWVHELNNNKIPVKCEPLQLELGTMYEKQQFNISVEKLPEETDYNAVCRFIC